MLLVVSVLRKAPTHGNILISPPATRLSLQPRAARVSRPETCFCALQMLSAQPVCSLVHKGEVMELLKCLNNELKLPLANATSSGDIASLSRVQLSRSSVALGSGTAGTARSFTAPCRGLGAARGPPSGTRTSSHHARGAGCRLCHRLCLSELPALAGELCVSAAGCLLQGAEQGCVSLQVSGTPLGLQQGF